MRLRDSAEFDVVGYGENSIDFLAVLGEWPAPDTKTSIETLEIQPGGQTATAVLAAARLGCRARYVGVVGDDRWGGDVGAALRAGGVEVVLVGRQAASTRTAVVLVDAEGRRTVFERRDPRLALGEHELEASVFQSARILMVDATDVPGSILAATAALATGTRVMVDVERPVRGLDQLLGLADVVIASKGFATDAAVKRTAAYDQLWITTLGADGSVARYRDREIRTPGRVVTVRDTTGAGDVFRGAFAALWAAEGGSDLEALLEFANAAGALACQGIGAQAALPSRADVEALLARPGGRTKSL